MTVKGAAGKCTTISSALASSMAFLRKVVGIEHDKGLGFSISLQRGV